MSPCLEKCIDKLQKIQNQALITVMGYRASTPINVIIVESKIPYLTIRFKKLGYKYMWKCFSQLNNTLLNNLELITEVADNFINEINFEKSLVVEFFSKYGFCKIQL